jgi:hypothetical protein
VEFWLSLKAARNKIELESLDTQIKPWPEGEPEFAGEEFRRIAKRFVELANEFLRPLERNRVFRGEINCDNH